MNVFSGFGSASHPAWLFCGLVLLFSTACATTRAVDEVNSPEDAGVDIGYGTVDEDHVVGSVSTVRNEDMATSRPRTLAEMLQQLPGVQVVEGPGGGISVRIRGSNTYLAGEDPLFVVDGMVMNSAGGLSTINPNNIASISVLKDAGATAIYGSRGANGVILIKTKRKGE